MKELLIMKEQSSSYWIYMASMDRTELKKIQKQMINRYHVFIHLYFNVPLISYILIYTKAWTVKYVCVYINMQTKIPLAVVHHPETPSLFQKVPFCLPVTYKYIIFVCICIYVSLTYTNIHVENVNNVRKRISGAERPNVIVLRYLSKNVFVHLMITWFPFELFHSL